MDVPKAIKQKISGLREYQLARMYVGPLLDALILEFTRCSEGADVTVELSQIAHIQVSKTLDDEDGCYLVHEANIERVTDGGTSVLTSLGYRIRDEDGSVFSYPSQSMYHLHLEGDVCIEVVCGHYQVYEAVKE